MASGKQNRPIQGQTQVRNVRRDSIVDKEVTAAKLNPDVVGNGLVLNPTTNAIDFIGSVFVSNTSELSEALASGETNIFLRNGNYILPELSINSDVFQLTGESKDGVNLSLPPSGTINITHPSGLIVTGEANLNISNPGIVEIAGGNVSGNAPLFSWQGANLVIDNLPYKVLRVSSGEVSGVAEIELTEPWTGLSSFTNKEFKLLYLREGVALQNFTITSASDSGIIYINKAKDISFNNVNIKGFNILDRATSGIKGKYIYQSSFLNTNLSFTNAESDQFDRNSIELEESHYLIFDNLQLYNSDSSGLKVFNSSFINFTNLKVANLNGRGFTIIDSENIELSNNLFNNVNFGNTILSSKNIYLNNNYIETASNDTAIKIVNSSEKVFINSNNIQGVENAVSLFANNSKVYANNNFIVSKVKGVEAVSGSILRLTSNTIESSASGIVFDNSITDSMVENNRVNVSDTAFEIPGIGNLIGSNTVLSGAISIAADNRFPVLNKISPVESGEIDIGESESPFKDLYLDGNLEGVTNINFTDGGAINNVNLIELTGFDIEAISSGVISVGGIEISGLERVKFVYNQIVPATTWDVTHNLGTEDIFIQTYDSNNEIFIPNKIKVVDENNVQIVNPFNRTGSAVILGESNVVKTELLGQYVHEQTISGAVWNVEHNADTTNYSVSVFDADGNIFIPSAIQTVDSNNVQIINLTPKSGKAVFIFENSEVVSSNLYHFEQAIPSDTWVINHNKGTNRWSITVRDSSGSVFIPNDIKALNSNVVEISLSEPTAGDATFFFPGSTINSNTQFVHTQNILSTTWNINHGLNSENFVVTFFDGDNNYILPQQLEIVDSNNAIATFSSPVLGRAILVFENAGNVTTIDNTIARRNTENTFTENVNISADLFVSGSVTVSGAAVYHENTPVAGYLFDGTPYFKKVLNSTIPDGSGSLNITHGLGDIYSEKRLINASVYFDNGVFNGLSRSNSGSPEYWTCDDTNFTVYRAASTGAAAVFANLEFTL